MTNPNAVNGLASQPQVSEYVNYSKSNLFDQIEKDENGQFKLKVIKKDKLTHDSYIYELEFPNKEWISGLWPGGHFHLHLEVNGSNVSRKYTPISLINRKGSV